MEQINFTPENSPTEDDPATGGAADGQSEEKTRNGMEREGSQTSFPSLSEKALEQLALSVQSTEEQNDSQPTEEDIENKFTALILAFKTDKLTLKKRLELQNRLRDQTELNMTNEVESLKTAVQQLEPICTDSEKKDIYEKICIQVEALHRSTLRVSSAAELYGAVQQENRLSKAVDVIQQHVENLKEAHEKEKSDHEETRKLLNANKATAATVAALKDKRRASIATLHRQQNQSENNSSIHNDLKLTRKGSQGRRLMNLKNEYIMEQGLDPANVNSNAEPSPLTNCDCEKLLRRNSSNISQNDRLESRRLSQQNSTDLDSDSEDDCLKMEVVKEEPAWTPNIQVRQKLRKRSSFHAVPWVTEIVEYFEWLRPLENFALHARYSLAAILVIAAICVISSGFINNNNDA